MPPNGNDEAPRSVPCGGCGAWLARDLSQDELEQHYSAACKRPPSALRKAARAVQLATLRPLQPTTTPVLDFRKEAWQGGFEERGETHEEWVAGRDEEDAEDGDEEDGSEAEEASSSGRQQAEAEATPGTRLLAATVRLMPDTLENRQNRKQAQKKARKGVGGQRHGAQEEVVALRAELAAVRAEVEAGRAALEAEQRRSSLLQAQ
ncbi:hypothetical protein TSOC_001761, partial [Tetrabaena socialis]